MAPSLELQFRPGKMPEKNKGLMKADYEYDKDKGDYYYETNMPFYKKIMAKKLSDKIIGQFD